MAALPKMTAGERAEILAAGKDPAKVSDLNRELGPAYPEMGASVAKYRRLANAAGSVMALPREARVAYANALEAAIHAKNNAWWKAGSAVAEGPCRDVGAKIRAEHARALAGALAASWAKRKPAEVEAAYVAAMAEKRARAEGVEVSSAMLAKECRKAGIVPGKPVGRAGVDWRAAGLKAAETRKRNLAAKAAAMKEAA